MSPVPKFRAKCDVSHSYFYPQKRRISPRRSPITPYLEADLLATVVLKDQFLSSAPIDCSEWADEVASKGALCMLESPRKHALRVTQDRQRVRRVVYAID